MSTDNKPQGLTATQKISLVAGTLPVLYLLPSDANAAIVYRDNANSFSVSYSGPNSVEWDVDGDGNNDFLLRTSSTFSAIFLESAGGRNGRGVVRSNPPGYIDGIQNLASGFVVGPTLAAGYNFGPSPLSYRGILRNVSSVSPNFDGGVLGSNFIGFRFETGAGDILYGWAEVILSANTVTVERWAYNDTLGGSIAVGEIGDDTPDPPEPPVTTPEPSSGLALLAMGAAGVYRWRKKRKAA